MKIIKRLFILLLIMTSIVSVCFVMSYAKDNIYKDDDVSIDISRDIFYTFTKDYMDPDWEKDGFKKMKSKDLFDDYNMTIALAIEKNTALYTKHPFVIRIYKMPYTSNILRKNFSAKNDKCILKTAKKEIEAWDLGDINREKIFENEGYKYAELLYNKGLGGETDKTLVYFTLVDGESFIAVCPYKDVINGSFQLVKSHAESILKGIKYSKEPVSTDLPVNAVLEATVTGLLFGLFGIFIRRKEDPLNAENAEKNIDNNKKKISISEIIAIIIFAFVIVDAFIVSFEEVQYRAILAGAIVLIFGIVLIVYLRNAKKKIKNSERPLHALNGISASNELLSNESNQQKKESNEQTSKITTRKKLSKRMDLKPETNIEKKQTKKDIVADCSKTIPKEELMQLKDLYDKGIITEEEFKLSKKELLNI